MYRQTLCRANFGSASLSLSVARLLCAFYLIAVLTNAHPQYRKLACLTKDRSFKHGDEKSKCHLVLKDTEDEESGRSAPEDAGCFTVKHNSTSERVYCDIYCPKAHTVFHSAFDLFHRSCFQYHNYQLEQKGENWYLWRSDRCLNSTANFYFGCKFDTPFRKSHPNDQDIFAELRRRKQF
uniref:DUF7808 domain-containing protein n=1 Tax=Syphacia muris TaxID=451379 RepID=A0A0N5AR40_9BILA